MMIFKGSNGQGLYMAIMAGVSAACASIFAKTAASEDGAHSVAVLMSSIAKSINTDLHRLLFAQNVIVWVSVLRHVRFNNLDAKNNSLFINLDKLKFIDSLHIRILYPIVYTEYNVLL